MKWPMNIYRTQLVWTNEFMKYILNKINTHMWHGMVCNECTYLIMSAVVHKQLLCHALCQIEIIFDTKI